MKEDRGEGREGGRDEGRTSKGGRAQRKHQGRRKLRGGGSTQEGEHIWKFPCFPLGLLKNHQSAERVVVLWEGMTPSVPTCL